MQGQLVKLKAARQAGLPPTVFIQSGNPQFARLSIYYVGDIAYYEELPQDRYTELDIALSAGYQYYLDSLCPRCGVPAWYGRTEDNRVELELEHSTCYSCAELEREKKNEHTPKGQTSYVSYRGVKYQDGTVDPLPEPLELLERVH